MNLRDKLKFWIMLSNYVDMIVGPDVSPLSLPDAIANSLSYVKAFGGTEQSGTPTPDTPMDIVSNNGVLKWDSVNQTVYADGTVEKIEDTIGNTATTEMLLKVGDFQDVQSILDGVVTRNVGIKVLDGTEDWRAHATIAGWFQLSVPLVYGGIAPALCTHYPYSSIQGSAGVYFSTGRNAPQTQRFIIADNVQFPNAGMLAEFKQFLADQYAAGTPVIVVSPLATATTESVTGQTLQVTDGDNVLEITQASLNGLELECKYKKQP